MTTKANRIERYYDTHEWEGDEVGQGRLHFSIIIYLVALLEWLFYDQPVGVVSDNNAKLNGDGPKPSDNNVKLNGDGPKPLKHGPRLLSNVWSNYWSYYVNPVKTQRT
ncbi:MAG: hypothetical protein WCS37_15370 [Chloroflexota bacterium]|nr:hypothetical protein [Chloroflexota bacterium]